MVGDVRAFESKLGRQHLLLRFGREVLAGPHRHGACDGTGDRSEKHLTRCESATDHAGHEQIHRDEAVVDAEDHVPPVLASLPDMCLVLGRFRRLGIHPLDVRRDHLRRTRR